MALNKVTYTDLVTVIGAGNLNDIQDAVISLEGSRTADEATLNNLSTAVDENTDSIGDLSDLTTTAKTDLVSAINEAASSGSGLTEDIKQTLLDCFEHVAWIDADGQDYYDALEAALYPPTNLVSISAVYTQSGTVYDTYVLNTLKPDLVVKGHYSDGRSATITGYALSGTLEAGTSTVTVTYDGKTTTFNVTVTSRIPSAYRQVEYLQSDGTQAIATNIAPRDTMTEVAFEFVEFRVNYDNYIVGAFNSDNQRYYACWLNSNHKISFANRSNVRLWEDETTYPTGKHTIVYNNASHQALYDGIVRAIDSTFACTSGDNPLMIYTRQTSTGNYDSNTSISKIYSLKFTDNSTGDVIGEFIPCYRKSDDVGGFYDLVTETFYTDMIEGEPFVWGAESWEDLS